MRHFITVALCTVFLLPGCASRKSLLQPGVSLQLAQERKEHIAEVHYTLFFNLPAEFREPVEARQTITFRLKKPRQVILDFSGKESDIHAVIINGQPIYPEGKLPLLNEHLVFEHKYFQRGENYIEIAFCAGDQSLNRNEDFLYTLLVPDRARTLFPCFDQPNLKAVYTLSLEVPTHWQAVSNTPVEHETVWDKVKTVAFGTTEPLSTYLFSFVAGDFQKETECRNGRCITMYHRETDSQKLKQTKTIFDQVFASLQWMEEYTDIPYPFAKYDFIVLPGFQYGGMEHTGATLYNDKRLFLGTHPTTAEQLSRMSLIAHETAHMWFGDYVTMEWFDEVWLKEVFANYFAARMTEPQFPQVNHRLNNLHTFYASAYNIDRAQGTHPIVQPLDNLEHAGLIYGNIIYNKTPVVMDMLAEQMGAQAFREGLRRYLHTYAYGNATWDQLIAILDSLTPHNLADWSRVWVHEAGLPHIRATLENQTLTITQTDPLGRGLLWPQPVTFTLTNGQQRETVTLYMERPVVEASVKLSDTEVYILPNTDGKAYGVFLPDSLSLEYILDHLANIQDEVERMSLLMTLYENTYIGRVSPERFIEALLDFLPQETNALIQNRGFSYLNRMYVLHGHRTDGQTERFLYQAATDPQLDKEYRLLAFRTLLRVFTQESIITVLYDLWDAHPTTFAYLPVGEAEFTRLAYELMVRLPEKAEEIRERQLAHITNPDRRKAFEFIAQGCNPNPDSRDAFFQSLLLAENRHTEPWVVTAMEYLNHFLYREHAIQYIRPVLEHLEEVRQTGDIFFPTQWLNACLAAHNSRQTATTVRCFFKEHPQYNTLLRNKILQAADHLPQEP
ncbi:MAG TPA: M1 family aminopeptidase [Bacteroidales bacterium]|nr:M1 family aminopeptidase [Bacteroidales bacterium]